MQADFALSEYNLSNMNLKYYILSLYRKYNLSDSALIAEDGTIKDDKVETANE